MVGLFLSSIPRYAYLRWCFRRWNTTKCWRAWKPLPTKKVEDLASWCAVDQAGRVPPRYVVAVTVMELVTLLTLGYFADAAESLRDSAL